MPSPAEYETETSGNSPTAAPACSLAHPHAQSDRELLTNAHVHAHNKLVRQNSVRAESSEADPGNLTPEIVIIKNGTLSRSCTEETERVGDSVQEIYSPSTTDNNNETAETKFDFEDEDDVLSARSASSLTGVVIGDSLGDGGLSRLQGAQGGLVRSSSEHLEAEVSKFEFEVFETETPSRGVSTVFICLYTAIGATILTMIVLTLVFDFGMMLLLGMTAVIFIIIVILTNMCTMVYQL